MSYLFLVATILCEVAALTCYAGTISFMTLSLKRLDLSIVYATWSGMGIALVTLLGFVLFRESFQPTKLIWIALIAIGVVGLNLTRAA